MDKIHRIVVAVGYYTGMTFVLDCTDKAIKSIFKNVLKALNLIYWINGKEPILKTAAKKLGIGVFKK